MDRGSITVLIIEDNSGDARLLKEYLTESSDIQFSLLFADSLSAANKYLSQESLDVIILDLGLPDSQGAETFTKVAELSRGIPIVILTGLGDMNTAKRIIQMGAQDYLVKGDINPSLIQRTIQYAIERQQYQLSLKSSEERQRILIRENADGILVVDSKKVIHFVNPAAENLMGKSADDLVGKPCKLPLDKYHVDALEIDSPGKKETIYVEMRSADINWDGEKMRLVTLRDVSEREKAELKIKESEIRYQSLFNSIRDAIVVTDTQRKIINCNEAFSEMFGYSLDEVKGKSIAVIYRDREQFEALGRQIDPSIEGTTFIYPVYYRRKDDSIFPGETGLFFVRDNKNSVIAYIGMVRDITIRMQYEAELKRWESIFKNAKWGVAVGSKDGQVFELVNQAYAEMHGLSVEEMSGMPVEDMIAPESRQDLAMHIQLAHEKGHHSYEAVHIRKDGSKFPVQVNVSDVRNKEGGIDYRVVNVMDITERKQMQEALVRSEEKYRTYIEHSPIGIYVIDQNGNLQDVNRAACEQIGYTKDELTVLNISDLVPSDDLQNALDLFSLFKEKGLISNEIRLKRKDGSTFPIILDAVKLSDDVYMGYCTDIKEREAAIQALRERDQLLNKIFDILPVGLWIADKNGKLIRSNAAGRKIWGAEPLVGQEEYGVFKARRLPTGEEITPEDWALAHSVKEGVTVKDEVLEIDGFDGVTRTILNYTAPVLDNQGQVQNAVIVNLDISELKKTEVSLKQSEEKYRNLFENVPVGIFRMGLDNTILDANQALAEITGFQNVDEIKKKNAIELSADKTKRPEVIQQLIRKGALKNQEFKFINANGDLVDVLANLQVHKNAGGDIDCIEGTIMDITDYKRTSQALDRRDVEISQLYEAGKLLNESLDLDTLYDNLHDFIFSVVPSDRVSILSYDSKRNGLEVIRLWHGGVRLDTSDYFMIPFEEWWNKKQQEVIRSGRPIIVNEESQNLSVFYQAMKAGDKNDAIKSKPFLAAVYIPIKDKDEIVGALNLFSYQKNAFSNDDMRFLELLCQQIGVAVSNASLYEQTRNRVKQLSSLHSIDKAISSSFSLDISLNILINTLIEHLEVDAADVLLFKPYTQSLEFYQGKGFSTPALQHTSLRLGDGYAGKVALNRKRMVIADISSQPGEFVKSDDLMAEGFFTYIGVPLVAKGKIKGVIEVFHRSLLMFDDDWLEFLDTLAGQAAIAVDNYELFNDLQYSNLNLSMAYDETIKGWSQALDLRDHETEGHTQRVTEMTLRLAQKMGVYEDQMVHIKRGSLLHDIGKMGVSDTILLKPGPLNDEEWDIMRQHPIYAHDMLSKIAFLEPALEIPYCHHERWDGTGYPRGLKGEQIPLAARIFAVIDVWDALISDRPYRKAWPHEEVVAYIKEQSGSHFDPKVVDIFLNLLETT